MKELIESREDMEQILERSAVGRLGLITRDGPYIVPLNFAYKDGSIYFDSGLEGRKLEAIRENPRACFEVDELLEIVPHEQPCLFTTYYRSVIAWGTVRVLDEEAEKMKGIRLLLDKHAPGGAYDPPPDHALAIVTVCEMTVEEMTGKANLPDGGPA